MPLDQRRLFDLALGRHGAQRKFALVAFANESQLIELAEINDHLGPRHAHIEQRDETLPARKYLRLDVLVGEHRHSFFDAARYHVVEGGGLHTFSGLGE